MADYPNLRARYSKGTLKLRRPLRLPDGTEVRVSITLPQSKRRPRLSASGAKRKRDRYARADQRGQIDDGVRDLQGGRFAAAAQGSEPSAQKALVRGKRIGAGDGDEQAAHDEGEDD